MSNTLPIAYLDYFEGDQDTGVGASVTLATLDAIRWFPVHESRIYRPGGSVGTVWTIAIDGIDEYDPCIMQSWFSDWESASLRYFSDEHAQFAHENLNSWRWDLTVLSQRLNKSI